MERSFDTSFAEVRIHTDAEADSFAQGLEADAVTTGNRIHFAAGMFRPTTPAGRDLMAHELSHVVSQRRDGVVVERAGRPGQAGVVTGTIHVTWSSDPGEFFRRLVAATSRQFGINDAALWQPLYGPSHRFSSMEFTSDPTITDGRRVAVSVELGYHPGEFPEVSYALVEQPAQTRVGAKAAPAAQAPAPPPESDVARPGETPEQRLRRQARTTVRVLSQQVADADAKGYAAISLTLENTGDEIIPGFEKFGTRGPRPAGASPLSADGVSRRDLGPILEMILISGAGRWRVDYARDEAGRMEFVRAAAVVPSAGTDELAGLDLPDRKKIYADIFKKTNEVLKEEGIKLAMFGAEQIALWVLGGVLFRALGLVGSGVAEVFPILRRALQLERAGDIAIALESLAPEEANEFAVLMKGPEKGVLSRLEQGRLGALMAKVERALGARVPTLRVISKIGESPPLVKAAEGISEQAQREVNELLEQYLAGNKSPGIGTRNLEGPIFYLRGRNGGRLFLRETQAGYVEVLGKADKSNESAVIDAIIRQFSR